MQNFIEAFDEEIEFLEVLDYLEHGVPRQINHRSNYFETMDASTFRKRFRLSKETVLNILAQIEDDIRFTENM